MTPVPTATLTASRRLRNQHYSDVDLAVLRWILRKV